MVSSSQLTTSAKNSLIVNRDGHVAVFTQYSKEEGTPIQLFNPLMGTKTSEKEEELSSMELDTTWDPTEGPISRLVTEATVVLFDASGRWGAAVSWASHEARALALRCQIDCRGPSPASSSARVVTFYLPPRQSFAA